MFMEDGDSYSGRYKALEGNGLCHITYLPNSSTLVGSCYEVEIYFQGEWTAGLRELHSMLRQGGETKETTRAHSAISDPEEKEFILPT